MQNSLTDPPIGPVSSGEGNRPAAAVDAPAQPAAPPRIPTEDDIRAYAFHLFTESSQVDGHDLDHWLEAKACLTANISPGSSHTRLHRLLNRHEGAAPLHHGFTMPPSEAGLGSEPVQADPTPSPTPSL